MAGGPTPLTWCQASGHHRWRSLTTVHVIFNVGLASRLIGHLLPAALVVVAYPQPSPVEHYRRGIHVGGDQSLEAAIRRHLPSRRGTLPWRAIRSEEARGLAANARQALTSPAIAAKSRLLLPCAPACRRVRAPLLELLESPLGIVATHSLLLLCRSSTAGSSVSTVGLLAWHVTFGCYINSSPASRQALPRSGHEEGSMSSIVFRRPVPDLPPMRSCDLPPDGAGAARGVPIGSAGRWGCFAARIGSPELTTKA